MEKGTDLFFSHQNNQLSAQRQLKNKSVPFSNPSEKIIVLADEAHRSQYGDMGVNLNIALPNAPKIVFTGTPLIKTQKTSAEFGSYIDTYTIEQAVQDKGHRPDPLRRQRGQDQGDR